MEIIKKNAFILAEYNPFHNGHKFHIEKTCEAGAENIICVMNGNFVQRGSPALCSKLTRAKTAIQNGADLVLELPMKYGISAANHFAYGGVMTASLTGLDGTLSFGTAASADDLSAFAKWMVDQCITEIIKEVSEKSGKAYPAALNEYAAQNAPEFLELLNDPNAVLAAEYVSVIRKHAPEMDYYAVNRSKTAGHNAQTPVGVYASAQYIREKFVAGKPEIARSHMPSSSFQSVLSDYTTGKCTENGRFFSDIALSSLYSRQAEYFTQINGVAQGLENRIVEALKTSSGVESLYDSVKTKRFTHARIRQIVLSALLDVKREDLAAGVSYIRVLGFNDKGKALLREMRKTAKVPVITNISDITESSSLQAQRDKLLDITAGKLFELCKTNPENGNPELLVKPYIAY